MSAKDVFDGIFVTRPDEEYLELVREYLEKMPPHLYRKLEKWYWEGRRANWQAGAEAMRQAAVKAECKWCRKGIPLESKAFRRHMVPNVGPRWCDSVSHALPMPEPPA